MDVLLVPGFLNGPSIMRRLAGCLSQAGHTCHLSPLRPNDGRGGLERLSAHLAAFVRDAVPATRDLVVVGFSMGALVARHYLQSGDGIGRARAFFSIAGPHRGTYSAYFYPSRGVRDMRKGSEFLRKLDRGARFIEGLPTTSYWTPFDGMVRPPSSAILPFGDNVCIPALLHSMLPFDARLHRDLTRRMARLAPNQSSNQTLSSVTPLAGKAAPHP
jgi:triacylglycerol lipase